MAVLSARALRKSQAGETPAHVTRISCVRVMTIVTVEQQETGWFIRRNVDYTFHRRFQNRNRIFHPFTHMVFGTETGGARDDL